MIQEQVSLTALTAAAARAAHLIVDNEPLIFVDPLARPLLGGQAEEFLRYHREQGAHPILAGARAQVTSRSRYTEDRLAAAVRTGLTQYVLLGAGLDSFAYRSELAGRVRVFEVDHPATQKWKRQILADAGIGIPDTLRFVATDLETDSLAARLTAAGFDPGRPALIAWLGVTMYLTEAAIGQTLAVLGGFAPGTELILDYLLPAELRDPGGEQYAQQVGAVAAERGEPWLSFFRPAELTELLATHGLPAVQHVAQRATVDAALWQRSDSLRPLGLSCLAHATVAER